MQVGRSHNTVMGRRVVLGEIVTKVSAAGFPINDKLAFPGVVLDPIEAHIHGFGVGGCGCPSSWRVVRIGTASWPL